MDLEQIQKVINDFYFNIFDQKEFNEILEEVTFHKINEEKKQFYIKDSALKYLDMNYYYSPMIRSKAEIYISDFKKDVMMGRWGADTNRSDGVMFPISIYVSELELRPKKM